MNTQIEVQLDNRYSNKDGKHCVAANLVLVFDWKLEVPPHTPPWPPREHIGGVEEEGDGRWKGGREVLWVVGKGGMGGC